MPEVIESLILDFLEWLGPEPRPYAEVMDAWRTSCPRLTIWEDATDRGYIARTHERGRGPLVERTPLGQQFLDCQRGTRPKAP
jgi:hypothetical protein